MSPLAPRLLVALLLVVPAAANDFNAICTTIDPILSAVSNTALGLSCTCSATCADNVGGDGSCAFTSPSITLTGGGVSYTVPTVTVTSNAHVLPCASAGAKAGASVSVTMPTGMPTEITDAIATLVADQNQHMTYDASSQTLSVERSIASGQTETIDVPFYKIGFSLVSVQFLFRIIITVTGNMASFTVDQDLDMCIKLGTLATICGSNLPTCVVPATNFLTGQPGLWLASLEGIFCTAIGNVDVKSLFLNPPFDIIDFTQDFSSACTNTCDAPPPPAPPVAPGGSGDGGGGGGGAVVGIIVGVLVVGLLGAGAYMTLKKGKVKPTSTSQTV